jgi:hypothetical protein
MDWNTIINGVLAQGPVAGVLLFMWWRSEQRADKWSDMYVADAKETIATLTTVSTALSEIKDSLK